MKQKVQKMLMLAGALLLTTVVLAQVPSNDETCGALLLSPNESGLSCPPEGNDYTTAGATASPGNPCGLAAWGDVWFKFIATADSHRVHISKVHALAGGIVNPGIAVYNSTDCTALGTAVACRTTGPKIMTFNTTPGDMYYIRVWTAGYELPAGPDHFTFKLCLGAPTAAPDNDDCTMAVEIEKGVVYEAYTHHATGDASTGINCWGEPVTDQPYVRDVWYKVTARANGPFTVTAENYAYFDVEDYSAADSGRPVSLEYRTSCTAPYTPVEGENCMDNAVDFWTLEPVPRSITVDAVAGETYYFRVWQHNYGQEEEDGGIYFRIWAEEPEGGAVLPVGFDQLSVVMDVDNSALLTWNYYQADETGFSGFTIEHAADGKHFTGLDSVSAKEHQTAYNYRHVHTYPGKHFYRVAVNTPDGLTQYSNVAVLTADMGSEEELMSIGPNPLSPAGILQIRFTETGGTLYMTDIMGRQLWSVQCNESEKKIDTGKLNLSPGIYTLHYYYNNRLHAVKLIIE